MCEGGGNMGKTQPDRIAIKQQLSLLCGLMTDEYYFPGTFNIYSRYVGVERGLPRSHDPNTT